jgi:DNA-binding phage protein
MVEVREYLDIDGHSPYGDWFDRLNAPAAAKVAVALARLATGNFSNVKGVGSGLFEYKIDFGPATASILASIGRLSNTTSTPRWLIGRTTNAENKRRATMALTRNFKETIRARVERDPKFRKGLLREGIASMIEGDIATAKTILRDYINATVGFTELAEATHIPSKSLMRMLGPSGNPRADNLFEVVGFLQRREGVRFNLRAELR